MAATKVPLSQIAEEAWTTWTPTWTGVTVGNGTVSARRVRIGKTVIFEVTLVFGSTTAITTTYPYIDLPVAAATTTTNTYVGQVHNTYLDSGTAWYYGQFPVPSGGTTSTLTVTHVAGTYAAEAGISSTIPMTWTTGDKIIVHGVYEGA